MINLDFEVCQLTDCKGFEFTETTSIYAVDNTGGYGTPNNLTTDFTMRYLEIYLPKSKEKITYLLNTLGFPSSDPEFSITITAEDLGVKDFSDGICTITYFVNYTDPETEEVVEYKTTGYFAFLCKTECCRDKKLDEVEVSECSCSNAKFQNATHIFMLTEIAKFSAECGKIKKTEFLIDELDKLCNLDCGCS